ncbi:hypothetical protein N7495_003979 [Penicillium taxi]|uniref:uncharacterized protein n=1 Tax=Penicillium taxi TaxID=168475 RepID=UPI002545B72B|nr:uncharacterized protein N7495_003979 [Penicillium taxi]KAJ5899235.1 hypothetical protein N7495_003979 [Penicillium taxi]
MPNNHYPHMDDNLSLASYSTVQHSIGPVPPVQLRQRNTVKQWVVKRISQRMSLGMSLASTWDGRPASSLDARRRPATSYNELSAKNLANLAIAIEMRDSTLLNEPRSPTELMHEIVEEEIPDLDPETVKSRRISKSYADFCYDFTLSGSQQEKKTFDMNMTKLKEEGVDDTPKSNSSAATVDMAVNDDHHSVAERERERPQSIFPSSPSAPTPLQSFKYPNPYSQSQTYDNNVAQNRDQQLSPPATCPLPPPDILTPTMYREQLAKKASKKSSFWQPLRSVFSRRLHFWGPSVGNIIVS